MDIREFKSITGQLSKMDNDTIYKCDKCKRQFKAGDVVLREKSPNLEIIPPFWMQVITLEYDGKKYHIHCPLCDSVSLFGFDKA